MIVDWVAVAQELHPLPHALIDLVIAVGTVGDEAVEDLVDHVPHLLAFGFAGCGLHVASCRSRHRVESLSVFVCMSSRSSAITASESNRHASSQMSARQHGE